LLALCAEPQRQGTVLILLGAAGKNKAVPSLEPSTEEKRHRQALRTSSAQDVTVPLLVCLSYNQL